MSKSDSFLYSSKFILNIFSKLKLRQDIAFIGKKMNLKYKKIRFIEVNRIVFFILFFLEAVMFLLVNLYSNRLFLILEQCRLLQ